MFHINRILDRIVSVMSVKFACVKSSEIIHKKYAHAFPMLADKISEIQDSFNVLTDYLDTPKDVSDYNSLEEMFQKVLDNILEANDLITGCIEICIETKDYNVKASLENFLSVEFIKYIRQSIILRDKAKLYGDNVLSFDRHIDSFFVLE
jgi:adenylosuccinate synthase